MRFAGLPSTRIALRLGISHDAVSKRVKSQRFLAVYEQFREKLEARVDEAVRLRVSDAVLAAVDDLLEMRDKARGWLRRQLNLDIMGLHEKYARVGAGGPSDLLRAIHEKTVRRGAGGSTTETERMIYEGGRGVVEAVTGVAEEVQPPPPREEAAVDAEWEEAAAAGSRGSDGNDPPASG
jgi:predicted transcriptional regulator